MQIDIITRKDLEDFKNEILSAISKIGQSNSVQEPDSKSIKSKEARKILEMSAGKLQLLRIQGKIRYSKIGRTYYYLKSDVMKLLKPNS